MTRGCPIKRCADRDHRALLVEHAYRTFIRDRDIDAVLTFCTEDAEWDSVTPFVGVRVPETSRSVTRKDVFSLAFTSEQRARVVIESGMACDV